MLSSANVVSFTVSLLFNSVLASTYTVSYVHDLSMCFYSPIRQVDVITSRTGISRRHFKYARCKCDYKYEY